MNVVTQLTQFVGRDVINKNTTDMLHTDWLYAVQLGQLSWVELRRYRHPHRNSTRRRVELRRYKQVFKQQISLCRYSTKEHYTRP